jgi:hypothetical protein
VQDVSGARQPAGRAIRLVPVAGVLLTDASALVADIVTTVKNLFSMEIAFRNYKEIVHAGQ